MQEYSDKSQQSEVQSEYMATIENFEEIQNEQGNMVYRVPSSIAKQFRPMCNELDSDKDKYGISNYSIRCSTLEEVFIKIGKEEDKLEDEEFSAGIEGMELLSEVPKRERSSCWRLTVAQIVANFQI
jgi:hypothetical protein